MASSILLALLLSAPCPTSLTFAPATGRPPVLEGQPRFAGMVGSSFVTLTDDDATLGGAKIDLLHPDWREVPALDLGRWTGDYGLADEAIVVGQRLLEASWRGRLPIRVAVYDPQKNAWRRPDAATPLDAWYEHNLALRDWWLTGNRDGKGGYRFHPVQLTWTRMKPAPVAGSMSWLSVAVGNKAYFFADRGGVAYDADSDSWTALSAGGPARPARAYASSRTGRIAVLSGPEYLAGPGAVYDPATRAWTPIAGSDQVVYDEGVVYRTVDGKRVTTPVNFREEPSHAGPYVAFFSEPCTPIWLLDIEAARWRPVPQPPGMRTLTRREVDELHDPPWDPLFIGPPLVPEPKLLLAGETIFLEGETCLDTDGGCLSSAHVGEAGHLYFYEPESGRWCSANLPAAAREALGGLPYFTIERPWRNHLLLWEAHPLPDPQPYRRVRVELVTGPPPRLGQPRGGVVSW